MVCGCKISLKSELLINLRDSDMALIFIYIQLYTIKTQISFAVDAKLISAFVFATYIVQSESLYFLNPKFQASSHLLRLRSPVCVGPGREPRRPVFSQRGSYGDVPMMLNIATSPRPEVIELFSCSTQLSMKFNWSSIFMLK